MPKHSLMTLRYQGPRFDGHTLPVDMLKDIVGISDMLHTIARYQFKSEHGRQRLPRGFLKDASIDMAEISAGSAKVSLVLVLTAGIMYTPTIENYYNAIDTVMTTINQASSGSKIDGMTKEMLPFFDKFGIGLRDGESIELTSERPEGRKVAYTQTIREALLKASSSPEVISRDVFTRGRVTSVDTSNNSFDFDPIDGAKITSTFADEHFTVLHNYLAICRNGSYVSISGVGRYKDGRLDHITEINEINELDEMDVGIRIAELAKLKEGWLDGEGHPLDRGLCSWFVTAFDGMAPSGLQSPYLYPTPEGGLSVEWDTKDKEVAFELVPGSHTVELMCVSRETGDATIDELDLDTVNGWARIATVICDQETGNA